MASCGAYHCLVADGEGQVFAWGQNNHAQLGLHDRAVKEVNKPTPVPGMTGCTQLAAGKTHSLGSSKAGVFAWGRGTNGMLGVGDGASIPRHESI